MSGEEGQLDANLAEDLKQQGQEPVEPEGTKEPEGQEPEGQEGKVEPKTFDEDYVKGLRRENAKYRRQARDAQAQNQRPQVNQFGQQIDPNTGMVIPPQGMSPQTGQPNVGQPYQGPQQQGPVYDPRVDDMLLGNKIAELKQDEYLGELFKDTDDEGRTFEERLLESAVQKGIPIEELDSLAWKMEKAKILGKVKQKGIDESYESMKNKGQGSAEKNVSSGKNVETGEADNIDDAVKAAMKKHGVTDLSNLG